MIIGLVAGLAAAAGWLVADPPPAALGRLPSGSAPPKVSGVVRLQASWRGRWLVAAIAAPAAAATWLLPVPSLVAIAAGCLLRRRWRVARAVRAQTRQRVADVRALRALTAELRGGLPPAIALRTAGQVKAEPAGNGSGLGDGTGIAGRMLAAAAAEALGSDAASVLRAGAAPGSPQAALGAAWTVCQRTGARLAAPVSRIADGAAANLRTEREADAALAGARSSAHLLAALPLVGIALGSLSGTGSVGVLLHTVLGQACLTAGVALDLAGLTWLDRLAAAGRA